MWLTVQVVLAVFAVAVAAFYIITTIVMVLMWRGSVMPLVDITSDLANAVVGGINNTKVRVESLDGTWYCEVVKRVRVVNLVEPPQKWNDVGAKADCILFIRGVHIPALAGRIQNQLRARRWAARCISKRGRIAVAVRVGRDIDMARNIILYVFRQYAGLLPGDNVRVRFAGGTRGADVEVGW